MGLDSDNSIYVAGATGAFLVFRLNVSIREVGSVFAYLRKNLGSAREAQALFACLIVFQVAVIALSIARFAEA
ncbi:MAG: hypothetical protein FHP92_00825 [Denitromonas halophila]|nr:MAG: hypothetical protein FHP92_00825 [Denitromonas halophila]